MENFTNVLVVGLGRTGLPQALTLAKSGHIVVGLDHDSDLVDQINSNHSPFWEPELDQLLKETLAEGSFRAVTPANIDPSSSSFNAIVISIGASVDSTPRAFVESISTTRIIEFVESDPDLETLILNRATVPIGTTQAIADYLEVELSQNALSNVHIAHVPERIAEGKATERIFADWLASLFLPPYRCQNHGPSRNSKDSCSGGICVTSRSEIRTPRAVGFETLADELETALETRDWQLDQLQRLLDAASAARVKKKEIEELPLEHLGGVKA